MLRNRWTTLTCLRSHLIRSVVLLKSIAHNCLLATVVVGNLAVAALLQRQGGNYAPIQAVTAESHHEPHGWGDSRWYLHA